MGEMRLDIMRLVPWGTMVLAALVYVSAQGPLVHGRKRPKIERSNEFRIKHTLLHRYDKTTRPVREDNTPVNVNVAISLYHILDTNEKQQTFTCLLAIRQRWKDEYLMWNATEYGDVSTVRIPSNMIWTPDLVISNFAGDKFNDYMITNAIVTSDGGVLWLFPALIKTYCTLDVQYFPFDQQACDIQFISWTHNGDQLDVLYNESFPNSIYYNSANQEWAVDRIDAERHVQYYACCAEPYPDVTFKIVMKRGSLFYIMNLIAPCFLIFLISFLGFFLPVESGEKVNLETTILLALVVFLLMVGETMPPTPDAVPILGLFFGLTMVMVTIALVMAVISTNIYAKKDGHFPPAVWLVTLASYFYTDPPVPIVRIQEDSNLHVHQHQHVHQTQSAHSKSDYYGNGRRGDILSISDGEIESLTCSCNCCGCRSRDSDQVHSGGFPQHDVTSTHAHFHHLEKIEKDWKMIAKFSDRFFFWVFVVISVCVFTMLFLKMIQPSSTSL